MVMRAHGRAACCRKKRALSMGVGTEKGRALKRNPEAMAIMLGLRERVWKRFMKRDDIFC